MKAKLTLKLGDKTLALEGEGKEQEMIKALSFWSSLPTTCTACNSTNVGLMHKSPKENDYYGLKCNDCTAEFTFHQKKAGGFYITPQDTWKVWDGKKDDGPNYENDPGPEDSF